MVREEGEKLAKQDTLLSFNEDEQVLSSSLRRYIN